MSLQLLSDRAIRVIAENKIRAAIEAGDFDNLPGFGKPSSIIDEPYDPHWWIRRKLRQERLVIAKAKTTAFPHLPADV